MDRKTEYDFAKSVLLLERMGLKEAASKLEEGSNWDALEMWANMFKENGDVWQQYRPGLYKAYKQKEGEALAGEQVGLPTLMINHDMVEALFYMVEGKYPDGEAAMEEADKPDFLDVDKDGDKEESMKKAADDAEIEKESDIVNEDSEEEVENLEEKHDCEKAHPGQSHDEYMAKKNEAVSLKGMTRAELTEVIKEMIRNRLNK